MRTSSPIIRQILLTGALVVCFAATVQAQTTATSISPSTTASGTAPAKGIGPAAANTPQHHILTSALSPETRQTLQEAMNSFPAPASTAKPATK